MGPISTHIPAVASVRMALATSVAALLAPGQQLQRRVPSGERPPEAEAPAADAAPANVAAMTPLGQGARE
jgi:hypothetical protein